MIDVSPTSAMLFVRCRGGISHHPDEHVDIADADAGARVLLRLIENFRPEDAAAAQSLTCRAIFASTLSECRSAIKQMQVMKATHRD